MKRLKERTKYASENDSDQRPEQVELVERDDRAGEHRDQGRVDHEPQLSLVRDRTVSLVFRYVVE